MEITDISELVQGEIYIKEWDDEDIDILSMDQVNLEQRTITTGASFYIRIRKAHDNNGNYNYQEENLLDLTPNDCEREDGDSFFLNSYILRKANEKEIEIVKSRYPKFFEGSSEYSVFN